MTDKAYSSQSGATARQIKEVLMVEERDEHKELTPDESFESFLTYYKTETLADVSNPDLM